MNKIKSHSAYHISLIGILLLGLVLIAYVSPQRSLQLILVAFLGVVYVLLGSIHHYVNHDLVLKIVIEYILIAGLGFAAAFFIFKGGLGF